MSERIWATTATPDRARFPATERTTTDSQVFAIDEPLADTVTTIKALLNAMAGHVLARGALTGTYER